MFFRKKIIPVKQDESHECALACLVMMMRFHGAEISLSSLRSRYPNLTRGGTLRDIIDITQDLGLAPRALKVELEGLNDLRLPCIIHWGFNHFVVLEKNNSKSLTIVDPAVGRRNISLGEFSQYFTGVALELDVATEFVKNENDESLSSKKIPILSLKSYFKPILQYIFLTLLVVSFSLVSPLAIQIIVDEVIVKNDQDLLLIIGGAFLFSNIFGAITSYIQGYHIARYASMIRSTITRKYLDKLFSHSWSYFSRRNLGNFVAQYDSLGFFVNFIIINLGGLISDILLVLVLSTVLFFIDSNLALMVVGINTFLIVIRVLLLQWGRRLQDSEVVDRSVEQAFFVESMSGISSIKANKNETNRILGNASKTIASTNSTFAMSLFRLRYGLLIQIVKSVEIVVILYFLTTSVMQGIMSVGVMYAFYSYRQTLDQRLTSLVDSLGEILNIKVHYDRLADIFNAKNYQSDKMSIAHYMRFEGKVELRNIHYSIDNGRKKIIDDFGSKANNGEFILISGATGSGKTTLLKIILGINEQTSGEVLVDDIPITESNLPVLRNSVGVVLQEDQLFKGSIVENITLFDSNINLKTVEHSCQLCLIHEEIIKLPLGYQTEVGDMGSNLSTGQRQRVLLARALYKNPNILILDEATANLNKEIEIELLKNIKSLGKTVIFASHSDYVKNFADHVWLLNQNN